MITTYAELQAAILAELDHNAAETIAAIPDRIKFVENDIIRTLTVEQMEKRAYAMTVSAQAELALPSDYVAMRYLQLDTDETQPLVMMQPHELRSNFPESEVGEPTHFAVVGGQLIFGPVPNQEMRVRMGYYAFDRLSDANTSNWVLLNHTDVYLFGALMHMNRFVKAFDQAAVYQQEYLTAREQLKILDMGRRYGATMQIQSDTHRP